MLVELEGIINPQPYWYALVTGRLNRKKKMQQGHGLFNSTINQHDIERTLHQK